MDCSSNHGRFLKLSSANLALMFLVLLQQSLDHQGQPYQTLLSVLYIYTVRETTASKQPCNI